MKPVVKCAIFSNQKHVSRRLSSHIALNPRYVNTIHEVSLDISESEDKNRQMKEDHNSSLTRFEQSCGDVDDDACLPLRSVFPISFDCLYSHVAGPEDDADDEGIGNGTGSNDVGSFVGRSNVHVGSDPPSPSATLRRLPKRQRQQQQRRSALAPTSCLVAG